MAAKNIKTATRFDPPETPSLDTGSESLVQQQFKDEADINTITRRYLPGQFVGDPRATRQPMWGDFTGAADFQAANNAVMDAKFAFSQLPARIRARFDNDPYQLLRFVENPANKEEAVKLGLIEDVPVKDPNQTELPLADGKTVVKADPEANPAGPVPPKAP